ncbi:hypothetical protein [Allobranchiibius sp. GilTou38]|uniref:hypothetical protein n=1 Tax=Allobranchiibius sp. GilTou38 TaxID=2815210 RepID=UPI001AA15EFD|nr:hypothetical protein [Allobranchiibius sp. GilTou38]MBO1765723.1 hypothetical protein [Allobranchiibius sp. GilTou38]
MTITRDPLPAPGTSRRAFRRQVAASLATDHDGVCHREQLRRRGVTRDDIRHEVQAGRWILRGHQTVQVQPGGPAADWWRAVWEVRGSARLDGVSALLAAGLRHWEEATVHVSVPEGTHITPIVGVTVHKTRHAVDITGEPVRTTPEWAALHAAAWAGSDRAATTLLAMAVQQRITTGPRLQALLTRSPALPRIHLIRGVVADVTGGAQALSEIDFAKVCRTHGIPEPLRQAMRRGHTGRIYLDAFWDAYDVAVEVDGFQHTVGHAVVEDALRDNVVRNDGVAVLRIPVLGLRVAPTEFAEQVKAALHRGGWPGDPQR